MIMRRQTLLQRFYDMLDNSAYGDEVNELMGTPRKTNTLALNLHIRN